MAYYEPNIDAKNAYYCNVCGKLFPEYRDYDVHLMKSKKCAMKPDPLDINASNIKIYFMPNI
jgi:hypothetical protein